MSTVHIFPAISPSVSSGFAVYLGLAVILGLAVFLAIRWAIAKRGPSLLTLIDQITAGTNGVRELARVSFGEHPAQELVVWGDHKASQERSSPLPVLIFIHGGSWNSGSPRSYGFIARAFAKEGYLVVLAGYRLVPEGRYPAMLEDLASALAWTHQNAAHYGADPARIALVGHSAGAYNGVMTALDRRWLERAGAGALQIRAIVGLSGPYDFLPLKSDATIAAFGHAQELEPTQPAHHTHAGSPPMLFMHGEKDPLVGLHNSVDLAKGLNEVGAAAELVTYPDMAHNDPLIALASPWRRKRDVKERILRFFEEHNVADTSGDTVSVPVQTKSR